MTQPVAPQPAPYDRLNLRAVISVLETVAFIVAALLQIFGHGGDAVIAALVGASGHAVNHPAGGSPL